MRKRIKEYQSLDLLQFSFASQYEYCPIAVLHFCNSLVVFGKLTLPFSTHLAVGYSVVYLFFFRGTVLFAYSHFLKLQP